MLTLDSDITLQLSEKKNFIVNVPFVNFPVLIQSNNAFLIPRWVLAALQDPDRQAPALQVPAIPAVTARKMKTLMMTVQQCYQFVFVVAVVAVNPHLFRISIMLYQ